MVIHQSLSMMKNKNKKRKELSKKKNQKKMSKLLDNGSFALLSRNFCKN